MPQKTELLSRIEGLVLVTEENRAHLKKIVEKLEKEENLKYIEDLISREDHIIRDTIHAIIKTELEAGDETILMVIDKVLKSAQKEESEGLHIQEESEQKGYEEQAENLLKQM